MTTEPDGNVTARAQALLHSIGAQARQSNLLRVVELSEAVVSLGRGELSCVGRERAIDVAHQLVGSAGTFGYQRASALAREVEVLLRRPEVEPGAGQLAAAARSLALIEQDLSGDPDD